jgi:hypothetical protein
MRPNAYAAWMRLTLGNATDEEVAQAEADIAWAKLRLEMLGSSLSMKYCKLCWWLGGGALREADYTPELRRMRAVQVSEYVLRLKRGGLLK